MDADVAIALELLRDLAFLRGHQFGPSGDGSEQAVEQDFLGHLHDDRAGRRLLPGIREERRELVGRCHRRHPTTQVGRDLYVGRPVERLDPREDHLLSRRESMWFSSTTSVISWTRAARPGGGFGADAEGTGERSSASAICIEAIAAVENMMTQARISEGAFHGNSSLVHEIFGLRRSRADRVPRS